MGTLYLSLFLVFFHRFLGTEIKGEEQSTESKGCRRRRQCCGKGGRGGSAGGCMVY